MPFGGVTRTDGALVLRARFHPIQLRLGADVEAVAICSRRRQAHLLQAVLRDFLVPIARTQDEHVAVLAEEEQAALARQR